MSLQKFVLTLMTASLTAVISVMTFWKSHWKIDFHTFCSYLSLALPALGFVALRGNRDFPSNGDGSDTTLVADPPKLPQEDKKDLDDLMSEIEAEWRRRPVTSVSPERSPARSPVRFLFSAIFDPQTAFSEIARRGTCQ